MKHIVFLISFICSFVLKAQSIFPTNRFVDWKIAGSEEWNESGFLLINMQDYSIDEFGNQANDVLLDSILMANTGQSIRIHFPAGTFLFNETIQLGSNVILEGEGANQTHFVFQLGGTGSAIQSNGQALTSFSSFFQQTAIKNSNSIIINSNHGFVAGDWIRLSQVDSDLVYSSWAIGSVGQIVQIDQVSGDTLLLHSPLRMNYDLLRSPKVTKLIPNEHIGIRCLSIERLDDTAPEQASSIAFTNTVHSYIDGISSVKCTFAHVELSSCSNVVVRKSFFKDAFDYGEGGRAYGVVMHFTTNECRIEDNIFDHLRHAILLQAGANGNVSSFNFAVNPNWTNANPLLTTTSAGELVLHGNYVYANLFEQNKVDNIVIDNSHGANGPDNVFYRNLSTLYGVFFSDATSPNQIIIGNEITNSSFPYSFVNYTINGTGHFLYGNNNKGTITPSGTSNIPDTSFAYFSIPDFVSNGMWMQIGSGIPPGTANIPAAYRYSMNNYFANACGNSDSGQMEFLKPNLKIFPNPTSGILEVNSDFNLNDNYQILDFQGRVIFSSSMNTTTMTVNLNSLDPGIYFLTFNRIHETFPIIKL
ncbi:MAG: hypothetical protein RLZZ585_334 [Bacteroidota bacterium]|jgi:hypothetical protein